MRPRLLILCTGNSARSQMAEGWFRHRFCSQFEVFSAGTKPSSVRPEAIQVMAEVGVDISGHRSKAVDELTGLAFEWVFTVCDNAREACPMLPGAAHRVHWSLEDPHTLDDFRRVRDEIARRLTEFRWE
ncbi:MAG TPA: arsenate reductase ArsC [Paludibaculum sp.]